MVSNRIIRTGPLQCVYISAGLGSLLVAAVHLVVTQLASCGPVAGPAQALQLEQLFVQLNFAASQGTLLRVTMLYKVSHSSASFSGPVKAEAM